MITRRRQDLSQLRALQRQGRASEKLTPDDWKALFRPEYGARESETDRWESAPQRGEKPEESTSKE